MLEILKYPDDQLREKSIPVTEFDAKLHKLLDEMAVAMYGSNGVGLAAPQVGERVRLFIVDVDQVETDTRKIREFINPKITRADGKIVYEEGCLSVPGVTEEVTRKANILIEYQDRFGKSQQLQAEGLLAVAIQHENDHLDGVLFIDRLSPLKRRFVKKKLAKAVTL